MFCSYLYWQKWPVSPSRALLPVRPPRQSAHPGRGQIQACIPTGVNLHQWRHCLSLCPVTSTFRACEGDRHLQGAEGWAGAFRGGWMHFRDNYVKVNVVCVVKHKPLSDSRCKIAQQPARPQEQQHSQYMPPVVAFPMLRSLMTPHGARSFQSQPSSLF